MDDNQTVRGRDEQAESRFYVMGYMPRSFPGLLSESKPLQF